jgi:hypothetical protein
MIRAELRVATDPDATVERGAEIAGRVRRSLVEDVEHVGDAAIELVPSASRGS